MSEKGVPLLFVRETSGLVRAISPWLAIFLAITPSLGSYFLTFAPLLPVLYPGISLTLTFMIGGVFLFLEGIGTGLLMAAMPRSGGNYVVVGRTMGPIFGVMEGFRSVVMNPVSLGVGCYIGGTSLAAGFILIGKVAKNAALANLGAAIAASKVALVALGLLFLIVATIIDYLGPKYLGAWMTMWGIYIVLAILIGDVIMFTSSPELIQQRWDAIFGTGAYQEIVDIATKNGWTETPFSWSAQMSAMLIPVGMFWEYNAIPVSGEVRRPQVGLPFAAMGSAVVLGVVSSITAAAYMHAYGNFAIMYLWIIKKGLTDQFKINTVIPVTAAGYSFFGAVPTSNPALASFIVLACPLSTFPKSSSAFYYTTRPFFAMAMDRIAPSIFAHVSKYHSPTYTILYGAIWSAINIIICSYIIITHFVSLLLTFIFLRWWWTYSEVLLPYRRPEIYERGLKIEIAGVPLIAIVGVINFIVFGHILFSATVTALSAFSTALIFAGGVIWYIVYSHKLKKEGLDIEQIFATLPPE